MIASEWLKLQIQINWNSNALVSSQIKIKPIPVNSNFSLASLKKRRIYINGPYMNFSDQISFYTFISVDITTHYKCWICRYKAMDWW